NIAYFLNKLSLSILSGLYNNIKINTSTYNFILNNEHNIRFNTQLMTPLLKPAPIKRMINAFYRYH
ncbi:hypothetical protein D2F44_24870, partial [Salmonella enterica]|nr:hypothetical protein [Salmonella enterica]